MTAIQPFDYEGHQMRTVLVDGEAEFVAADVCRILGHSNPSAATAGLDDDERGLRNVETPSGDQNMVTVTEAGLYSLIIRSRRPEAKIFRRWVTHTVLPTIRRTGSYGAPSAALPSTRELAQMVIDADDARVAAEERSLVLSGRVAELEPKARTFDVFLGASGDYSVGESAKVLCRAGLQTGERRLFATMLQLGWVYRDNKGRPIPYQSQIDNGRLVAKARWYTDDESGEQVATTPQVRVTPKGLAALRERLSGGETG